MIEVVYSCDRCGKKFIPSAKEEKYALYGPDKHSATPQATRKIDLCEDCKEALRDFMED